jgi:protein TonB
VTGSFTCCLQSRHAFVTNDAQAPAAAGDMDFGAWTTGNKDPLRRRRMAVGFGLGSTVVTIAVVLMVTGSQGIAAQAKEEEAIAVELATEPEPEPEAEPPPPAEAPKPVAHAPKLTTPTTISDEKPAEAEVKRDLLEAVPEEKEEKVEAPPPVVEEAPKPPPPPPPPKAPPKPSGPIRITEEVTPPEPISQPKPEYPAALKAEGIEGVVMVRLVISETGEVSEAKVLKGPDEFHATCLSAVRTWRFKPALLDGKPVSVVKIVRIPFKLRT